MTRPQNPHSLRCAAAQTRAPKENQKELDARLFLAARHGEADKADECLRAGANPHATCAADGPDSSAGEVTPLFLAARHGGRACVERLASVSDLSFRDAKGQSALTYALLGGNLDCASLLVDCARLAPRDNLGRTPLMLSNALARSELAWAIIEKTDPRALDVNGRSAFWHSVSNGWSHVAEDDILGVEPDTNPDRQKLLDFFADACGVDALDGIGQTALMFCCMIGKPASMAQELVERFGADPFLRDPEGCTAADLAVRHEHWDCVEVLADSLSESVAAFALEQAKLAAEDGRPEAASLVPRLTSIHESFALARSVSAVGLSPALEGAEKIALVSQTEGGVDARGKSKRRL